MRGMRLRVQFKGVLKGDRADSLLERCQRSREVEETLAHLVRDKGHVEVGHLGG